MDSRQDDILKNTVEIIVSRLAPAKIMLFGSRAKSAENKYADFDLAVDAKKPDIRKERKMREEIEKISGLYKIDIVYMPSIDEGFREIVKKTGKLLYERRD